MFYVDRRQIAPPPELKEYSERILQDAMRHFMQPEEQSGQRRFDFRLPHNLHTDLFRRLGELFWQKCAYCEIPLSGGATLEHFRPKSRAIGLQGAGASQHYWWLAYSWENLLPVCVACNNYKSARFPVRGDRAPLLTPIDQIDEHEERLLIDPCKDNPFEHLTYNVTGQVVALSEQGKVTIDVCGLNRVQLIAHRTSHFEGLLRMVLATPDMLKRVTPDVLIKPGSPFLGFTVWALHHFYVTQGMEAEAEALEKRYRLPHKLPGTRKVDPQPVARPAFSIDEVEAHREAYFSRRQRVTSVRFRNFGVLEDLTLEFAKPDAIPHEPWIVLLGDNGMGKSTVLRGLALALLGDHHANALGLDARRFVGPYRSEAAIEVQLDEATEPLTMRCTRDDRRFIFDDAADKPRFILLGYGAMRTLRRRRSTKLALERTEVRNLFSPSSAILDVEKWLLNLDQPKFDRAALALKQILTIGNDDDFRRRNGRVVLAQHGGERRLLDLSDGFQAVIAMAGDILARCMTVWEYPEQAEGLILIDEVEVHLHPRWKLDIGKLLRTTFPRLTFVMTTHDPLCLHGLESDEVKILSRDAWGHVRCEPPGLEFKDLRVDQLLTSMLFGLPTTRPELEEVGRQYDELAVRDRDASEEARFVALRDRLSRAYRSGETSLKRTAEQLIEAVLAEAEAAQKVAVPREVDLDGLSPDLVAQLKAGLAAIMDMEPPV